MGIVIMLIMDFIAGLFVGATLIVAWFIKRTCVNIKLKNKEITKVSVDIKTINRLILLREGRVGFEYGLVKLDVEEDN